MGARANVVLYNEIDEEIEYSPVIYTHWYGERVNGIINHYISNYNDDTTDTNMYPQMRREIERMFPQLIRMIEQQEIEYQVCNFSYARDFVHKLPTANDMPIIADDYGLYLINISNLTAHKSEYRWEREEE